MQKSKDLLSRRAFQQVPRDMRRRTASHNVKRVPKRLQKRAAKEMKDDNTPTVKSSKRYPGSSRGRLRAETAKKLGILAAKKRAKKNISGDATKEGITTRAARPKIRQDKLNDPQKPKAKFRKRQIHKTWLPTHLWHAKRAKMTEPKNPLWRFAIPITCTEKSYRPTHRAGGAKGAVAWDTSYMSTIRLQGQTQSLEKILLAIGVSVSEISTNKGIKWRAGKRSWSGWLSREVKDHRVQVAPATIIWDIPQGDSPDNKDSEAVKKSKRRVLIRIHPSAFLEMWTELLRLSKMHRPVIHLEDLRFEIGSIEITGPGSTEALLGILHPYYQSQDAKEPHAEAFISLAGVTNPASLPPAALLSFSIMDPRLRYPPRPVALPKPEDNDVQFHLLEMLSKWPADTSKASSAIFDRDARYKATRLPSQKALNRRKALAIPGSYASMSPADPPIPIMLLTSRVASSPSAQGTWTLLVPWKCILPIWYGLMHYPLSSGGNPRFGGLDEMRQIHFEHGVPWFPADYPGTKAGYSWELEERIRRKANWEKRPKGKRPQWESLDLGAGRKGEYGLGWACDFEKLAGIPEGSPVVDESTAKTATDTPENNATAKEDNSNKETESPFKFLPGSTFSNLLSSPTTDPLPPNVITIRITLLSRGIASPCARIYRLPSEPLSTFSTSTTDSTLAPAHSLRQQWLSLLPPASTGKPPPSLKSKDAKSLKKHRLPLNVPLPERIRLLAQSLLEKPSPQNPSSKGEDKVGEYPDVPDEKDIIGFVTTGEFNLAEGKGAAIGTVFVKEVLEGVRRGGVNGKGKGGRLCIVRNAGEGVGRLARWEAI